MVLGRKKTKAFDALLSGLANFVNAKYSVCPEITRLDYSQNKNRAEMFGVLQALWDHAECIDEYLAGKGAVLPAGDKDTIASWNRFVRGQFVLTRCTKSGGILMGPMEGRMNAYLVQNFMMDWSELLSQAGLHVPAVVGTCLLPYDGVIVTDSAVQFYPMDLGPGVLKVFEEEYSRREKEGGIIRTL